MSRHFRSLLLCCTLVVFGSCKPQTHRTTGDDDTLSLNYQPYTVALKFKNEYTCTGSIISPTKILTAASCVTRCLPEAEEKIDCEKLLTVYSGSSSLSSGGQACGVKSVKFLDNLVLPSGVFVNDIAIVTLANSIEYSEKQQAIGLPDKDIVDGAFAVTSGWGKKSSEDQLNDNLQNFKRTIYTADKCNIDYFKDRKSKIEGNSFCATPLAENPGFCLGDGGSPLIQDGKIVGIASWGLGCSREYPEVYTNVYKYLDFIKNELQ